MAACSLTIFVYTGDIKRDTRSLDYVLCVVPRTSSKPKPRNPTPTVDDKTLQDLSEP